MDSTSPDRRTAAAPWPALSAEDLDRLRFFVYLYRTGRLRPPDPVGEEADALCGALCRELTAPRVTNNRRRSAYHDGPRPSSYHGGLPPAWQAWAEKQKQRNAQAQ
jgi:hypothetical protein